MVAPHPSLLRIHWLIPFPLILDGDIPVLLSSMAVVLCFIQVVTFQCGVLRPLEQESNPSFLLVITMCHLFPSLHIRW